MPGVAAAAAEWSQTYNGNLSESIATTTTTTTSHRSPRRGAIDSTRRSRASPSRLRPLVFVFVPSLPSPLTRPTNSDPVRPAGGDGRVRRRRLLARVPLLRPRQRGHEAENETKTSGGDRGGERRAQRDRVRVGQRPSPGRCARRARCRASPPARRRSASGSSRRSAPSSATRPRARSGRRTGRRRTCPRRRSRASREGPRAR